MILFQTFLAFEKWFVNNPLFMLTIPVFRGIIKQKLHKECFNEKSTVVAEKLKKLREGSHLSQAKLAFKA